MGRILNQRRESSNKRFSALRDSISKSREIVSDKACVYAIGSFGRAEAGDHSDLDLFIASKMARADRDEIRASLLKQLDEVCLKADVIRAAREQNFPEFSGDGRWLAHFPVDRLVLNIGRPNDDVENTLTARLLLLLESKCLIGENAYLDIIDKVIDSYWKDFDAHQMNFVPAFVVNDILRLWRTFCVNYEVQPEKEDISKKAKRRIKNFKLRQSRVMTCFSALLYLLRLYGARETVTREDFRQIVLLTPTERLERIVDGSARDPVLRDKLMYVIEKYEEFLELTNFSESDLIKTFDDRGAAELRDTKAKAFGEAMFSALSEAGNIGKAPSLYRLLVL